MAEGLARLMAPILPFTADELWRFVPGTREESVHLALFPTDAELSALADDELLERWTRLLAIREAVLAEIEPLRKNKQIGSSLQAKVVLSATAGGARTARTLREGSSDALHRVRGRAAAGAGPMSTGADALPRVTIERAGGVKCERCWRYVNKISSDPAWAGLCERCQDASRPAIKRHGATNERSAQPRRLEIWVPIVIVALDQLTKAIVRSTLPLHASVTVIPGLMDFTHVRNTGAAFGILNARTFRSRPC